VSGKEEWILEWDESTFRLVHPGGEILKATDGAKGYYLVDAYDVLSWNRVGFIGTTQSFKAGEAVIRELRAYLERAILDDAEYRQSLFQDARLNLKFSLIAFPVSTALIGLYLWYAFAAEGPSPTTWLRVPLAILIHGVLLILMGIAGGSPLVWIKATRLLAAIRSIEHRNANQP
jgi:hypothetical protein